MSSSNSAVLPELTNESSRLANESSLITAVLPPFPEIYRTHFNFVWSMVRYMGVDRSELDDVVQEIFVGIQAWLHTVERAESLRSWIYSIIRRAVSRYHNNRRSQLIEVGSGNVDLDVFEPERATPESIAEQSEQVQLIWSLLQKLDAPKREVFILAELEELSAREIAIAIEIPLNTVYSRLRVARHDLELAFQRHISRTQGRG
jgi:RNA polymerase sigma-70 factor, ECF subfamily